MQFYFFFILNFNQPSLIKICVPQIYVKPHSSKIVFRDRPFNLQVMVFCFAKKKIFRTTRELEYLFFFVAHSAKFYFQEFNIRLYDKNSESDYLLFPPPKSEYFFQ